MSNAVLTVNFAYADATSKTFSVGPFSPTSDAIQNFKKRLKNFNSVDETSGKKFTNLSVILKSDNGADLSGIKSAYIVNSQSTRIYDASTYGG